MDENYQVNWKVVNSTGSKCLRIWKSADLINFSEEILQHFGRDDFGCEYAARNSDFDGFDIHEGDYMALYGSQLFSTSKDIKVLLKALAQKVRDDGKEYITIYYGADVKDRHAQKAADIFADICPDADVNLIRGGQPVYYYMISAE